MTEEIKITPEVAAVNVAIKHCADKGIKSGLKGKQHAAILTKWAMSAKERDVDFLFAGMAALENGSALRKKLENGHHLSETVSLEESWM